MSCADDIHEGTGSSGSPQESLEEQEYPERERRNEQAASEPPKPTYKPSPKHDPIFGWGTENPIGTAEEGQELLDTGYHEGKQIYNITGDGTLVKFQPDGTPDNGYHPYAVEDGRGVPSSVLRQMSRDGKISKAQYNRLSKGKGKGKKK